jgi:hypothetical protein
LEQLTIGDDGLLTEVEQKAYKEMISRHGKAFAFKIEEMGCVNPQEVTPMIVFTVPHIPWDLKPIPVPKALLPQLVELLKEKVRAQILEPSGAPYSNRWFTIRKKNGKLRFIQDMQPPNAITIRNVGTGPIIDEFAEEFAGRAIYSIRELYFGYDQFQLAEDSSPYAAGWAVGQDDAEGNRFASRFGARIFTERQQRYPQIKRELWSAKIALKED